MNILGKRSDLPFLRKSDYKKENPWFLLCMSRMLAGKHKPNTVGRLCAWADHYLEAVICRSSDRLSANKKKEKFVSNDNWFSCGTRYFSFHHRSSEQFVGYVLVAFQRVCPFRPPTKTVISILGGSWPSCWLHFTPIPCPPCNRSYFGL